MGDPDRLLLSGSLVFGRYLHDAIGIDIKGDLNLRHAPGGRCDSGEFKAAPRGMPQIEVTFDIDANGIVEVSAKDQATGKQQSIRITHSSGLTQEEIDRLVKDAELHAGEDKIKKELIDARNAADALIYATEKSMAELGDKLPGATRNEIDGVITDLKQAMEGDNAAEIKRLTETLTHASHRLAESVYQQPGPESGNQTNSGPGTAYGSSTSGNDEEVVDAEYEEVR